MQRYKWNKPVSAGETVLETQWTCELAAAAEHLRSFHKPTTHLQYSPSMSTLVAVVVGPVHEGRLLTSPGREWKPGFFSRTGIIP